MRRYLRILMPFVILWVIAVMLTMKSQAASDGFNEIGFPFVIFREFAGKGDHNHLELGFLYKNLLLDVGIVLLMAFAYQIMLQKRRRQKK